MRCLSLKCILYFNKYYYYYYLLFFLSSIIIMKCIMKLCSHIFGILVGLYVHKYILMLKLQFLYLFLYHAETIKLISTWFSLLDSLFVNNVIINRVKVVRARLRLLFMPLYTVSLYITIQRNSKYFSLNYMSKKYHANQSHRQMTSSVVVVKVSKK